MRGIEFIQTSRARMNGGFFVFTNAIFKYLRDSDDLVEGAFHRLIKESQLCAYSHDGFWACMDTFKERQELEDLFSTQKAPWEVWNGR